MVLYLALYLVERGFYEHVQFVFLIVGHTKNPCDCWFNALKADYRRQNLFTFKELLKPQVVLPGPSFYPALQLKKPHVTTYSLGWFQYHHDGRFVNFHTGSLPGTIAIIGIIPDEELGVYIWGNLDHAEVRHALMYKVFDVFSPNGDSGRDYSTEALDLYTEIRDNQKENIKRQEEARVENTKPSHDLKAYTGTYTHPLIGKLIVNVADGKLRLKLGNMNMLAEHWHYDTFGAVFPDRPWQEGKMLVQFQLNGQGEVREVKTLGYDFSRIW